MQIEGSQLTCVIAFFGWNNYSNSRLVAFLSINLPGDERRALRRDVLDLHEDETNIFMSNLLGNDNSLKKQTKTFFL
jgi:hypothetical protein